MSYWRNYIIDGYDPADGLDTDHGRWMRDTWGVLVWVQTSEPEQAPRTMRGECVDCEGPCDIKATRCASCAVRFRWAERRRNAA